jgi:hypothetical protein
MQDNDRQTSLHASADDGEHRRRTLNQASAVISNSTVLDCKLRDISDSGAHLVFGGEVGLPAEFRLYNVSDGWIAPVALK